MEACQWQLPKLTITLSIYPIMYSATRSASLPCRARRGRHGVQRAHDGAGAVRQPARALQRVPAGVVLRVRPGRAGHARAARPRQARPRTPQPASTPRTLLCMFPFTQDHSGRMGGAQISAKQELVGVHWSGPQPEWLGNLAACVPCVRQGALDTPSAAQSCQSCHPATLPILRPPAARACIGTCDDAPPLPLE